MIIQEILENGLIHTYSDNGKKLIQNETGIMYDDAIDVPNKHTYTESEIDVPEMLAE